jgi:ATP-dependent helicase/DNAse subunit B
MPPFSRLDRTRLLESDDRTVSVIDRFIAAEQSSSLRDITTQPRYFELVFGSHTTNDRPDYPNSDEPVMVDGIKLRGKIDRIDMDENGNFVIIDYKSGGSALYSDIEKGLSLQLPLYLRIAEDLLRAHLGDKELRGVGALYHSLKKEAKNQREFRFLLEQAIENGAIENTRKGTHFESIGELEELIEKVVGFAKEYVDGIASGKFLLVRNDRRAKSCQYCEYQSVCRVAQAEADGQLPVVN